MMEWNNLVLLPMQDEGGTLGIRYHVDILKSLCDEPAELADLVTRHSLDRGVARHYAESARLELSGEPGSRARTHRPPKHDDV